MGTQGLTEGGEGQGGGGGEEEEEQRWRRLVGGRRQGQGVGHLRAAVLKVSGREAAGICM